MNRGLKKSGLPLLRSQTSGWIRPGFRPVPPQAAIPSAPVPRMGWRGNDLSAAGGGKWKRRTRQGTSAVFLPFGAQPDGLKPFGFRREAVALPQGIRPLFRPSIRTWPVPGTMRRIVPGHKAAPLGPTGQPPGPHGPIRRPAAVIMTGHHGVDPRGTFLRFLVHCLRFYPIIAGHPPIFLFDMHKGNGILDLLLCGSNAPAVSPTCAGQATKQ